MNVLLANPRGFCAGVDRAIEIVERALELFGAPIYVRHEVVHNKFVVENLRAKGAVFVEEIAEIPGGATVVFSAHGVSQQVRSEADDRGLKVFDATCPLVSKVHVQVRRKHDVWLGKWFDLCPEPALFPRHQSNGHRGHPEVEGTMGQAGSGMHLVETVDDVARITVRDPDNLAFVTQTTLSVDDAREIIDALRVRFPGIAGPRKDDICYATQNRQDAVKDLASKCDVVIVVGSTNSSNSNRLREVASKLGVPAYMLDDAADLDPARVEGTRTVGVTAGASAPENLVREVTDRLQELGAAEISELDGSVERVTFPLPKSLMPGASAKPR